jgi:hypothetical protein
VHKFGDIAVGDEVRLSEPERFAGYYATVIECNGIEALVEFPDRARSVVPILTLALVLRPAPAEPDPFAPDDDELDE